MLFPQLQSDMRGEEAQFEHLKNILRLLAAARIAIEVRIGYVRGPFV